MAVTAFPSADSPDLTLLNVARLFTRLEHNLLSPGSELQTLRKSEFQHLRMTKNVEYARTLLSQLERSLPQLKPLDRRHEAQTEIARDRLLLKRLQSVLDDAEIRHADSDEDEAAAADDEWKELFSKPISTAGESTPSPTPAQPSANRAQDEKQAAPAPPITPTIPSTTAPSASIRTSDPTPTSTLRNRIPGTPSSHNPTQVPTTSHSTSAQPSSNPPPALNPKQSTTEGALSAARLEQEDLTNSLLSLASQLKASSQSFQATLDNEKSILDRAVSGIDKTSSTMEAAGQRMGMLRRMTEGKGWWGRMMLYAWIFGLWVVAVLIVFIGPKLRF
ncbi:hypothetical protein N7462_005645 [Penicillium macrosclerotiorum]|uniref:uncharacterized protein n=1 Tax=Penicillium macrosclerotiorum TaxID=303699 RepID=UPI00254805BE|nr:uncharacterized protein N7462_005645 [Penicillium macrosclerotiorum]KAJ5682480.1 hypothetical protein N7462_005645 [Penicillium macrosclerotiorum]